MKGISTCLNKRFLVANLIFYTTTNKIIIKSTISNFSFNHRLRSLIFLICIALFAISCSQDHTANKSSDSSESVSILNVDTLVVYATNKDGTKSFSKTDTIEEEVNIYQPGHIFTVLQVIDGWYKVQGYSSDKPEFVKIDDTAKDFKVVLDNEEINEPYVGSEDATYLGDKGRIKVELISKQEFIKQRSASISYLTDSNLFLKKNGVLTIKTKAKEIVFKDKDDGGDQIEHTKFLGQFKDINKLLIYQEGWESFAFTLIDKSTGRFTGIESLPYLSSNKKKIVICASVEDLWREDTTAFFAEVHQFKVVGDSIASTCLGQFKNWLPISEDGDNFWGIDQNFYIKMQPVQLANTNNFRYVRVKFNCE